MKVEVYLLYSRTKEKFVSWARNDKQQYCPFNNDAPCGSWCPLFVIESEPKYDEETGKLLEEDFIVAINCGTAAYHRITEPIPDDCKDWIE